MINRLPLNENEARVHIKSHGNGSDPQFELDMNFDKKDALKILVLAIELAAKSEVKQSKNEVEQL